MEWLREQFSSRLVQVASSMSLGGAAAAAVTGAAIGGLLQRFPSGWVGLTCSDFLLPLALFRTNS